MAAFPTRTAFVSLVLLLCSDTGFAWNKTIRVSSNGSDTPNCGFSSYADCRTLDKALDVAFQNGVNSTLISLRPGRYDLSKKRNFTGVQDFAIVGHKGVEIRCSANISFHFILSDDIVFEGVHLRSCSDWYLSSVGAEKPFRSKKNVKFTTAMNFVYCKNVRLTNVGISETAGVAVNLYDVGGVVNFTNCSFSDNIARSTNNSTSRISYGYANAGGGVFLILNSYGYNPVRVPLSKHESYLHNNTYIFKNCSFLRNEAPKPGFKDHFETPQVPFSRGGGLGLYFRGNSSGCRIQILGCAFLNNKAQWGGGLQVEFRDYSKRNALAVTDTVFEENFAQFAGGGARVGNILCRGKILAQNTFAFENCLFRNNSAVWGGGASLYGTSYLMEHSSSHMSHNRQFVFDNSRFVGNKGTVGPALGIYLFNQIGPEVPFHVAIHNCDVIDNDVIVEGRDVMTGEGTVYSMEAPLTFSGRVVIGNNSNTALSLDGATVEIKGRVTFVNNSGFRGGAVSMYGRSKLLLMKKSVLVFRNNRCEEKGGALYVATPGPPRVNFNATGGNGNHLCFFAYEDSTIDYDNWDTKVEFQGNKAPHGVSGRSVFATTLKSCRRIGESRSNNTVLEWKFVKFLDSVGNETDAKKEISTDPIDIVFKPAEWSVAPNELFNATVKLLDEKGNFVYGIVHVDVNPTEPSSPVKLMTPTPLFFADGRISFVRLAGKSGDHFEVNVWSVGQQVIHKQILGVSLQPCHPGFRLEGLTCVCTASKVEGIARCSKDGKRAFLKRNFWGGMVGGKFATYRCPDNYCSCSNSSQDQCMYVPGKMCGEHRNQSSILCGTCERGYGVLFGSEDCSKTCSNLYLLLLPVYGIAFLLVVVVIMLIDLDVFTGYLNAWLYFYQVVTLLVREEFSFDPVMTFIIGALNFQLRVASGSCFAAGLDAADKLVIMYAVPVALLIDVYVLTKIIGAFPNCCFSRKVHAPFRAYCTLSVLCYTDITGISLKILHPATINNRTVLFQNGELDFFAGKHIAYGTLAIFFVLTFVLPFPAILMFRPHCTKCLRPVYNMNKIKPIFDALQSCFEDNRRWCAAFYFVCRLAILVVATYVPSGPVQRTLLETICIVSLAIFTYLKPYKQGREGEEGLDWINKSDAVLLTNLAVITVFSSAVGHSLSPTTNAVMEFFVDFFAYVPLLVLAVAVYRLVKRRARKGLELSGDAQIFSG